MGQVSHAEFLHRNGDALVALLSTARPRGYDGSLKLPTKLLVFLAALRPSSMLERRVLTAITAIVGRRKSEPLESWTAGLDILAWLPAGASSRVRRFMEGLGGADLDSAAEEIRRWSAGTWEKHLAAAGIDPRQAHTVVSLLLLRQDHLPAGKPYERLYRRLGVGLDARGVPVDGSFRPSDVPRLAPLLAGLALRRCGPRVRPGGRTCAGCPIRLFCGAAREKSRSAEGGPEFIDLFAGAGGFSLGFKRAGFRLRAAVELDKHAADTLYANTPDAGPDAILCADVRTLADDAEFIGMNKGVPLVIGGPPCQPFSIAHRHSGVDRTDERRFLFRPFIALSSKVGARLVLMENVLGLRSAAGGETLKEIESDFRSAGYEAQTKVLDASTFGVPQRRRRILVVAVRRDAWPDLPGTLARFWRELDRRRTREIVSLRQGVSGLPRIHAGEGSLVMKQRRRGRVSVYARKMRNPQGFTLNHRARAHNPRDIAIFRRLRRGEVAWQLEERLPRTIPYGLDSYGDKFRKLRPETPAPTIPAHLGRDANSFVHPDLPRGITCREAARLQSFPDNHIFLGGFSPSFSQAGNAVPPLLSRAIAGAAAAILTMDRGAPSARSSGPHPVGSPRGDTPTPPTPSSPCGGVA